MDTTMPHEVWEYTPSGRSWEYRYAEEPAAAAPQAARGKAPLRWMDAVALGLLACILLWFAHQFRTERVHAAAAAAPAKFASFYNCKLPQPGFQPQQVDGDPTHTQFHPYNYTVCDGVQVTLWSDMR